MKILTLDCGTHTGWAFGDGKVIESGVQAFDLKRGESPGMRYIRFNAFLRELLDLLEPEVVVYEMAHHRGGAATELMAGMTTRILEACAARKIDHSSVHSMTLKKAVAGSGRAEKHDMIMAANNYFGLSIIDDNQADAVCILIWARTTLGK